MGGEIKQMIDASPSYYSITEKDSTIPANHVIIREDYPLWVGDTQVSSGNRNDILGDGGKAKYDPETHTLTLDDPTIQNLYDGGNFTAVISSMLDDLVIKGSATLSNPGGIDKVGISARNLELNGDFSINAGYYGISASDLTITDGNITVKGDPPVETGGLITIKGGILTADGNSSTIYGSGIDIAGGLMIVEPQGGKINTDATGAWIVNADGTRAQHVVIMKAWPLWVGGTQVTDKNKADVFGDGTVSYSPDNNTLTLNNYDNKPAPNGDAIQYTGTDSFTIDCKGSNTLSVTSDFCEGIYVSPAKDLTINLIDNAALAISADNEKGARGISTTNGTNVTGTGTLTVHGTTQAFAGGLNSVADGLTVFASKAYEGTNAAEVPDIDDVKSQKFVQITSVSAEKPVAAVITKPTAKTLTANGTAQELVTEGAVVGGTMQYAIGKDDKTAPTSG